MKHKHNFELLEHTADVGVIGWGETLVEAFESAAYGMWSLVAELDEYEPTDAVTVDAVGEDNIILLERFLSSLLVIFDGDNLLPLDFDISELSHGKLSCRVLCRQIGDDIEWIGPTIKAVTYHQMSVKQIDGRWCAQVIFDV